MKQKPQIGGKTMRVRMINKNGLASDFDTIKQANDMLKKGWRDRADEICSPEGKWLEISDVDEDIPLMNEVPFAHPC